MSERHVPRLSLTRAEAAESLGVSLRTFERAVQPHVRVVRRGKIRLIAVSELEKWLAENSEAVT
jgi:excisionase family DNA binding protein